LHSDANPVNVRQVAGKEGRKTSENDRFSKLAGCVEEFLSLS